MLFDGQPRAIEAAARAINEALIPWFPVIADVSTAVAYSSLTAAVAALDRDELIEQAARANCDDEPSPCHFCRRDAERSLVAIGLIPEAPKESHDA